MRHSRTIGTHTAACACAGDTPPAEKPRVASVFYDRNPSAPNDVEQVFYALLVASRASNAKDLHQWAVSVLVYENRYLYDLDWQPPAEWKPKGNKIPTVYMPLSDAHESVWDYDTLFAIGVAVKKWDGAGQHDLVHVQALWDYKSAKVSAPGPPKRANDGPPRWKTLSMLFGVAALVKCKGVEMRALLMHCALSA